MNTPVTWPQVALALVLAIPSIIAALAALAAAKSGKATTAALATSNGKTVGDMVTDVHGEASLDKITFTQHHPKT